MEWSWTYNACTWECDSYTVTHKPWIGWCDFPRWWAVLHKVLNKTKCNLPSIYMVVELLEKSLYIKIHDLAPIPLWSYLQWLSPLTPSLSPILTSSRLLEHIRHTSTSGGWTEPSLVPRMWPPPVSTKLMPSPPSGLFSDVTFSMRPALTSYLKS